MTTTDTTNTFWKRLEALGSHEGDESAYWARFAELLAHAAAGRVVMILAGPTGATGPWRELARFGAMAGGATPFPPELVQQIARAVEQSPVAEAAVGDGGIQSVIGARIATGNTSETGLAVLLTEALAPAEASLRQERLRLLAGRPASDLARRREAAVKQDLQRTTLALEIANRLFSHRAYQSAAMAWVNELATGLNCSRAALSWIEGRHLRLAAVSQMERFSKKVEMTRDLEAVMDESLAQDDEVAWPADPEALTVSREHGQFAGRYGVPYLASIPLRLEGRPVGVAHLQRQESPFSETDLALLRALADQAAPWLGQLRRADLWRERARGFFGQFLGVERTGAKLVALLALLVVLGVTLVPVSYRVDAPFILRSSRQAFLPAPFEGYIASVSREIGDEVEKGDPLMILDDVALRQREAGLLADIERYHGEADQAESSGRFAERRIAMAQGRQAEAQLAATRYQLDQAVIRSPIAGRVVEGRHRERLGSVVQAGDLLFRVAQLDSVYAEIDIDERDVQLVSPGSTGALAFTSRPGEAFPLAVVRLDPAGTSKQSGNVFMARAELGEASEIWWRPGMTGVAKIDAGERSLLWIGTHRLVDFIRLKLWWW